MRLRPLRSFRRWREKNHVRYLEQEREREETERILDRFEDEVAGSRSPSMSRLKRW
jgi:hypothetical protein